MQYRLQRVSRRPSASVRRRAGLAALAAGMAVSCNRGPAEPPLPPATRMGYYVTVGGSPDGSGSGEDPWDLATALAGARGRIHPGDTVWLRRGVYTGSFTTRLDGAADAHIIFRQYPGERATIDGSLDATGSYLTFWGFEIMQSNPSSERVLRADTRNGRFINLVLHDAGISGVSLAADKGEDVELYGCLIYNNGTNENVDHGIYAHNATGGAKRIVDNVVFNNYARGIQVYSDGDPVLRNVHVEGNVAFNNGSISAGSTPVNLLISAPVATAGMVALDNLLYISSAGSGINLRIGDYDATHNGDIVLRGHYAAGGAAGLQMRHRWGQATVQNNTLIGSAEVVQTGGAALVLAYTWSGNRYHRDPLAGAWEHENREYTFADWKAQTGLGAGDGVEAAAPSEPRVFVRRNRYEPGRAHVVIYNWGRRTTVPVDLTGVLQTGDRYEIRNVQDFYGAPVVGGTYAAAPVSIPMNGVAPPSPIGRSVPRQAPRTSPDFDVFVVVRVP